MLTPFATELDSAGAAAQWFVLRQRGSVLELIPTRVDTVTTLRPCNDTGKSVRPVAVNGRWIIMFADVPGLKAGAVESASISSDSTANTHGAADTLAFTFRGEQFVIRGESVTDSSFALVHDGKSGRLTFGDQIARDSWWRVWWAGDLNRDGAPDVMIENSAPEGARYIRLYMSGSIPADRRWHAVAIEAHEGC